MILYKSCNVVLFVSGGYDLNVTFPKNVVS